MGKVVIDWDEDDNPITKTLSETEVQANCTKYGRLYDWSTAMGLPPNCNESNCSSQIQSKHRGIFPFGWHLPSKAEWDILVEFVTSTMGLTEDDLYYLLKSKKAYKTESYGWYNETGGDDNATLNHHFCPKNSVLLNIQCINDINFQLSNKFIIKFVILKLSCKGNLVKIKGSPATVTTL